MMDLSPLGRTARFVLRVACEALVLAGWFALILMGLFLATALMAG